jgi:CheY-like chemotaxis protein
MSAASARAMRVLVVDDDADTVESTALMLQSDGHEVATANDTLHTLVRVMSFHPELVLLDLSMPKIDGFRLARQIQQLPLRTTPCLVAVTGHERPADALWSAAAGFDLHLVKPVGLDAFRELTLALETSRRLTERFRELAGQKHAITTVLMFQQIEMANIYLDSATITHVDGLRDRYVSHAQRAYIRFAKWLNTGACPDDRIDEGIAALRALSLRLSAF